MRQCLMLMFKGPRSSGVHDIYTDVRSCLWMGGLEEAGSYLKRRDNKPP